MRQLTRKDERIYRRLQELPIDEVIPQKAISLIQTAAIFSKMYLEDKKNFIRFAKVVRKVDVVMNREKLPNYLQVFLLFGLTKEGCQNMMPKGDKHANKRVRRRTNARRSSSRKENRGRQNVLWRSSVPQIGG